MKAFFAALLVALSTQGCGATVPAAASRTVTAPLGAAPICFAPTAATGSTIPAEDVLLALDSCGRAARKQQVTVVPFGTPGCLVATPSFSEKATDQFEVECEHDGRYGNCTGGRVRHKSIRVLLSEREGGPLLSETVATIRSKTEAFNERSYYALCSAAFHDYPRPMRHEKFDADAE